MENPINSVSEQRQEMILDQLRSRSFLGIQDLCELLGVSEATARRDLVELESKGLLRRTHGGAVPAHQVTMDFTKTERLTRHAVEKQAIAQAAAAMVKDNDVVFLDAGNDHAESGAGSQPATVTDLHNQQRRYLQFPHRRTGRKALCRGRGL